MKDATVLQLTPTWKTSFVLPYESDWSIREKFSFMNAVARTTIQISKIGELRAFTAETIPFISQLPNVELSQFMETNQIRICPKCIKYGYHSHLHQFLFYDTCFIHKNSKLLTTNYYFQINSNASNYYKTNHTTTVINIIDNGLLLKEINKVSSNFTDHNVVRYINVNTTTDKKNAIYYSTRTFMRSQISSNYIPDARIVLSVAKKNLPEENVKAMKELSNKYPLGYVKNMSLNERKVNGQSTSAYMKTLIDDFIRSEFSSEDEYYRDVSIIDACKNYGKHRHKTKIDRYAKVITIMHILNSRKPTFYHTLLTEWHYPTFECYHPINIAAVMNCLGSVFIKYFAKDGLVQETDVLVFSQALLKDVFNDTSERLAAKILSGEFDIFDDMMIRRENFYIPVSQYILVDEGDNVTLYAYNPD